MNKLSIEELKAFEGNPTNNFLTRGQMMDVVRELIALREQKGEQVPVAITDDMAIAFHAATTDSALGRDDMEEIKAGLRAAQELFTAPQKVSNLPYDVLFNAIGKAVNIQGEALSISVKAFKVAIEAAGGIVKDGE